MTEEDLSELFSPDWRVRNKVAKSLSDGLPSGSSVDLVSFIKTENQAQTKKNLIKSAGMHCHGLHCSTLCSVYSLQSFMSFLVKVCQVGLGILTCQASARCF